MRIVTNKRTGESLRVSDPLTIDCVAASLERLDPVPPFTVPATDSHSKLSITRQKITRLQSALPKLSGRAYRKALKQLRHNERKLQAAVQSFGGTFEPSVSDYSRIALYNPDTKPERRPKLYCFACKCVLSRRVAKAAFERLERSEPAVCPQEGCNSTDVRPFESGGTLSRSVSVIG